MVNKFFVQKRDIPKAGTEKNHRPILILFALSVLFFVLSRHIPFRDVSRIEREMTEASRIMREAVDIIRGCQEERGITLDRDSDINMTGLIGLEFSPLTTSLGSLEAKRTTTNPNIAGLIVFLLDESSVRRGDTIAVGASGSFPALIVAVLSAAKALDLKPLVISSLGASQWGANNPDFHLLHIHDCLLRNGIFDREPIAFSLGGDKDSEEDIIPGGLVSFLEETSKRGVLFIREHDLTRNVEKRMEAYKEKAGMNGIKAFINIGGNWSNIGDDSEILKLNPGLVKIKRIPPPQKRGVLFEMALRKTPVIHLLNIRGLVERYGLPWDPVPLPEPGDGKIYQLAREKQLSFLILAAFYIFLVIIFCIFRNRL
ncbi:MAG: poly-gamma-glutamate system protein [Candidatus Aminicenantes bacterium]|nr:MAG: poly-gamma-glutamate system protein [Candidatus Aminicenantes bacterium]